MNHLTAHQTRAIELLVQYWQLGRIAPAFNSLLMGPIFAGPDGKAIATRLAKVKRALEFHGTAAFPFPNADAFSFFLTHEVESAGDQEASQREREQARLREEFDALADQFSEAELRSDLVALGRQRSEIAPKLDYRFTYENVCWDCHAGVSSEINPRCGNCHWYLCSCLAVGACGCNYR